MGKFRWQNFIFTPPHLHEFIGTKRGGGGCLFQNCAVGKRLAKEILEIVKPREAFFKPINSLKSQNNRIEILNYVKNNEKQQRVKNQRIHKEIISYIKFFLFFVHLLHLIFLFFRVKTKALYFTKVAIPFALREVKHVGV